jgi:hypothetical protein
VVLFFILFNGFFLKEFLLHPGTNKLSPINALWIVSASGYRTQAATSVNHPLSKDKASARYGKTGGFIGALRQKTTLPEPLCATDQRMRPWASWRAAC